MLRIKILSTLLLLLVANVCLFAQSKVNSLRKESGKVALAALLGNWYSNGDSSAKIEFVTESDYYIIIKPKTLGVSNYSFRRYGDSLMLKGTAANWPPYDCTVKFIDKNTIEICYYQFFYKESELNTVLYKRKQNK